MIIKGQVEDGEYCWGSGEDRVKIYSMTQGELTILRGDVGIFFQEENLLFPTLLRYVIETGGIFPRSQNICGSKKDMHARNIPFGAWRAINEGLPFKQGDQIVAPQGYNDHCTDFGILAYRDESDLVISYYDKGSNEGLTAGIVDRAGEFQGRNAQGTWVERLRFSPKEAMDLLRATYHFHDGNQETLERLIAEARMVAILKHGHIGV